MTSEVWKELSFMKQLLKSSYIPFGSQYYRAPSPDSADWERDLQSMADLGFTMVKFWVQWRWNHPAVDRFYFEDIDRLMDLAHEYRLKVMLNTIFDVAPAWIYQKYPDASMLTLDGRRIGPQTQPHRQIGGLGYCFNHDQVMSHFFSFLRETVKRYTDHPALGMWNVGSEPELTSSMAEMRLYADNADRMGDMLCYCEHCRNKFVEWIKSKYHSIEMLNQSWNRNYREFSEIELPITRNTFNDMIDWRMFFVDTLGKNVEKRFAVAREEDQGRHPLLCHHVFIQGFPLVSTANDPWNVGRFGDLHGFTQMDDSMMIDILRSCAKDKPVISAEMLMLPGYTLDLPQPIEMTDIKRFIFSGIAGNLKGFIFWQYRPEVLGREAPTWGLSFLDGSSTPWMNSYAEVGRVLQNQAEFILDAKPQNPNVAILYHPENQIFAWISTKNEKSATDSLLGTHHALYEHNFKIDFIHPREFTREFLNKYPVIYIPFPYHLGAKICHNLKDWVERGGILIAEAYFAGWKVEGGHHEKVVPGYGFDRVFGVRQGVVKPAVRESGVDIVITKNLPYIKKGKTAKGSLIQETYLISKAEVWAEFSDGSPAITCAQFGKGKAIAIGSYIGLSYHRQQHPENGAMIASLVEAAIKLDRPRYTGKGKVRIDFLTDDKKGSMIILQNLVNEPVQGTISIPDLPSKKFAEIFSKTKLRFSMQKGKYTVPVALTEREVKVYRG